MVILNFILNQNLAFLNAVKILFQINVVANSGSTGHIAEELGRLVIAKGWKSYIAYGRWACQSQSELIRIGNSMGIFNHALKSFLSDRHGLGSTRATRKLISKIQEVKPDIIHLHNIHGYYLNYKILFNFLSTAGIPVIWTLHDCWSMTGHCVHFQNIGCNKWKSICFHCPNKHDYPKSLFWDNSRGNYIKKKHLFCSVDNLIIVPVCKWLDTIVESSFLKDLKRKIVINGIDLNVFYPQDCKEKVDVSLSINGRYMILAVATVWSRTKGLDDIFTLRQYLSEEYVIVLVGLTPKQMKGLPEGIIGIERTENIAQLVELYSATDVFVNPTYQDTLPTVNIEALACGTPVVTYNTGGSADIVDANTGLVVTRGDIKGLLASILIVIKRGNSFYKKACRSRVEKYFNKHERYKEYLYLYNQLLQS